MPGGDASNDMAEQVIQSKSYGFALRIIRLYKYLSEEKKEFVLSKQVLLAGTYIGAHIKSAQEAETRAGFTQELNVALQKASETEYWLDLLREAGYLDEKAYSSIHTDCKELIKLLTAITKTIKRGN